MKHTFQMFHVSMLTPNSKRSDNLRLLLFLSLFLFSRHRMRVTLLAVCSAGFSALVAGVIQSAGCLHRPRVLICSNFPTTGRKAR